MNDSLGARMKRYERAPDVTLTQRMPVIIRVDGKAFHTYTKKCLRPFDAQLNRVMLLTAITLCEEIQGAQLAYIQSDEISVLLHGYKTFKTQHWVENRLQKMCSVAAGIASATFTAQSEKIFDYLKPAVFDARAFVVPEADVCNYFLWRQQDATRNSIQMLAQSLYSPKELHRKNTSDLQEMCFQKGWNWNDLETRWKRGLCVHRVKTMKTSPLNYRITYDSHTWEPDYDIPIFSQDRNYIERHLATVES